MRIDIKNEEEFNRKLSVWKEIWKGSRDLYWLTSMGVRKLIVRASRVKMDIGLVANRAGLKRAIIA